MAHRMQITLTDDQYAWLRAESERTGQSIAEIVRRSLVRPSTLSREEKLRALDESAGAWKDFPYTGEEFVERMRPGIGARLEKLRGDGRR